MFRRRLGGFLSSEAKANEAKKTNFTRLLVHFSSNLLNGFMLHYFTLCKSSEGKAGMNPPKQTIIIRVWIYSFYIFSSLYFLYNVPLP